MKEPSLRKCRVHIRITFTGIVEKALADEMVENNSQAKRGEKFSGYCRADKLVFGEFEIKPRRPFKMNVEIV